MPSPFLSPVLFCKCNILNIVPIYPVASFPILLFLSQYCKIYFLSKPMHKIPDRFSKRIAIPNNTLHVTILSIFVRDCFQPLTFSYSTNNFLLFLCLFRNSLRTRSYSVKRVISFRLLSGRSITSA